MDNIAWQIADEKFSSRLLMGSAMYPDDITLLKALEQAQPAFVTLAVRRYNVKSAGTSLINIIKDKYRILPNTAGCYNAKEAILTAQLAREALQTNWLKLEVIGDDATLLPDSVELLKAAQELANDGFHVMPYCNDDPIICKRLQDIGCVAVMPLASPIGSGLGVRNPHNIKMIRDICQVPLIIDAGIGSATDACIAMESGADAILLNTAVAKAQNPPLMAKAMRLAIEAGYYSYKSGRIPKCEYGSASTTNEGKIQLESSIL
jgi:thiazole synthase